MTLDEHLLDVIKDALMSATDAQFGVTGHTARPEDWQVEAEAVVAALTEEMGLKMQWYGDGTHPASGKAAAVARRNSMQIPLRARFVTAWKLVDE